MQSATRHSKAIPATAYVLFIVVLLEFFMVVPNDVSEFSRFYFFSLIF